jgi:pimeloyl-ACP methyl ester carboxylesterase
LTAAPAAERREKAHDRQITPELQMTDADLSFLPTGSGADAAKIAVRSRPGKSPGILWLGGFKSDMKGTKAAALDAWAAEHGRACVRFDYSGHGESEGAFVEGTIGRWLAESVAVFEAFCRKPFIVVGSSMGGWLALLLARKLKRHADAGQAAAGSIAALVLIAPAVDFTEVLMWEKFPASVKKEITEKGSWERPSAYGDAPYPITRKLIEDGRRHLLMGELIQTGCPVRILQGVQDPDVPFGHAMDLVARLANDDVVLTLVKDGDHRLSRPEDIERLTAAVAEF